MKKTMYILFALLVCLVTNAAAADMPSVTVQDMTEIKVSLENPPEDILYGDPDDPAGSFGAAGDGKWFYIRTVREDEIRYEERLKICQEEIEILAATENLEDYFGEVVDKEGEEFIISDALKKEDETDAQETDAETDEQEIFDVYEYHAVIAGGYEEEYGKVTADMKFPTPYEEDTKVVVLFGEVTVQIIEEEEVRVLNWTAYEGAVVRSEQDEEEEAAWIRVELEPEIVLNIQEGVYMLAIASEISEEIEAGQAG